MKEGRASDTWHLDEAFIEIEGKQHYLRCAVDQDDDDLDILVQPSRNAEEAMRFFSQLLKRLCYSSRMVVTDKLRSYGAAYR